MQFFDRLNPFFVYEIRQLVRNRAAMVGLCLYPAGLLALAFLQFAGTTPDEIDNGIFGKSLAATILSVLYLSSSLIIVLYSVLSTIHQGLEDELLFQTPVGWYGMACAKFQVASCLGLLFYSVTLPFLTLAWLLRGVDLVALFLIVPILFLTEQGINFFLVASVVRSQKPLDRLAATSGVFLAGFPLALMFFIPLFFAMAVMFEPFSFFFWFKSYLYFLSLFALLALSSGVIFKEHFGSCSSSHRFFRLLFSGWGTLVLWGFLCGYWKLVLAFVSFVCSFF